MAQKKKLQVFVSSTFSDLQEERQAAVEAILTAGHIPAGMELFAAGDESQMNVIKRWIDESDVYMLILGGRYGSIEPKTQKSYTQLEYEYAVEKNKSLFAVVIDEKYLEKKIKKFGSSVIEKDHSEKLNSFRKQILTKMVRFFSDPKEIKLAILETMAEFSRRDDLVGWVPGNEAINSGVIAEEIARLAKENAELQLQIKNLSESTSRYNGLTFEEIYEFLNSQQLDIDEYKNQRFSSEREIEATIEIARALGEESPSLLHYFLALSQVFDYEEKISRYGTKEDKELYEFGLLKQTVKHTYSSRYDEKGHDEDFYALSEGGKQFLLRLKLNPDFRKINIELYILKAQV
jgi:hypothetical protein